MSSQLMTLKDLRATLGKHKNPHNAPINPTKIDNGGAVDINIACNIVDAMFTQISRCLQQDRSRIKVNALAKGVIIGLMGDKTRNGMKDYLANMFDEDIKDLLNDIQRELDKRK